MPHRRPCLEPAGGNTSATTLTNLLLPPDPPSDLSGNVLRMFLHPDGARHGVTNWPQVASVLIDRLASECTNYPRDADMIALYHEVTAYPGVIDAARPTSAANLLTEIVVEKHSMKLRLYPTISTIVAPTDITLEELRLEALLPADAQTTATLRQLAAG